MWYANVEPCKLSVTHDGYAHIVNDTKESKANTLVGVCWSVKIMKAKLQQRKPH